MRKLWLSLISLFFILLLNQNVSAGCYPRHDIESDITIRPKTGCIGANVINNCLGDINLLIGISCEKDYFILDKEGKKIDLDPHTEVTGYNKSYFDYTIPQDFSKWERKLINKENPNDIIYIKGENYSKYYENNGLLIRRDLLHIILLSITVIILYVSRIPRLILSKIKNRKK